MSNQHHLCPSPCSTHGEVQHINYLSDHISSLFMCSDYSDIALIIEGEVIPSHKIILAARSDYFRALLYGGLRESSQGSIELKETSLRSFKILLKYIYTGHMLLAGLKEDMILDILGLAHKYGFVELENSISDYLKGSLSIRNICVIYDKASLYNLSSLLEVCSSFMDRHALDVLHHDSFPTLSESSLKEVIGRDSFCAPEVDIFRAVSYWVTQNPSATAQEILGSVRLPLMTVMDLLNVVRPTKLISPDTILDAIKTQYDSKEADLRYRGCLMPEVNVATQEHGAQVLDGERRSDLLDGDVESYDMERGFSRHPIDDNNSKGLLVKLGNHCIINHMRLLLWDRDNRSYSYYIEVSVDQRDWVRVIDHSKYYCRSWQFLYFEPRVVKYIRIVGTHNTVNRVFHCVSFECMYTNKPMRLENGLVVPSSNVATIAQGAFVIEGVSRRRNALIDGDTENYDWDSGYTCHQLGSGAIVVQLAQPFMIDSIRLLLWDCDDRSYCYYVTVSVDQKKWKTVCSKKTEACRSWQLIQFTRQPVVFIRIVGTNNTANEVFHCVHLECPAQVVISSGDPIGHSTTNVTNSPSLSSSEEMERRNEIIFTAKTNACF